MNEKFEFEDAWTDLDKLKSIEDFVPFLRAFIESGTCGYAYPGDAFGSSSNAAATWFDCFADRLEEAISKIQLVCKPEIMKANAYFLRQCAALFRQNDPDRCSQLEDIAKWLDGGEK